MKQNLNRRFCLNNSATNHRVPVLIENPEDGIVHSSWLRTDTMWCEALAQVFQVTKKKEDIWKNIYVDLIVIHLSCSSFLVSVNLVSPALDEAMIPALLTSESVSVDLPWSTWAMTDMFLILHFRSMISRIWSTVKFTCKNKWKQIWKLNHSPGKHDLLNYCIS